MSSRRPYVRRRRPRLPNERAEVVEVTSESTTDPVTTDVRLFGVLGIRPETTSGR